MKHELLRDKIMTLENYDSIVGLFIWIEDHRSAVEGLKKEPYMTWCTKCDISLLHTEPMCIMRHYKHHIKLYDKPTIDKWLGTKQ